VREQGSVNGSTERVALGLIAEGLVRPQVTAIIPTLNEEQNIGWVLERLPRLVDEVVIIDGRSTDRTIEVALTVRPDARVVLERRPGKGAALRAGFRAARGEFIVMLDADGSMDPGEIVRFVEALRDGWEFVKGSRFMADGGTVDMTLIRRTGNAGLLQLVNRLYGRRFTDLCYGFCAFRRTALAALELTSDGFEIETEIVVRACKAELRIIEVPSFESARRYGVSNLSAWRDGRRVLRTLLRERVSHAEIPAHENGNNGAPWAAAPDEALAAGTGGDEARA
jgi:glycosyltransferase involved in cell wall biosynthesis